MANDDGGPAFPRATVLDGDEFRFGQTGMTLRDWLAGQIIGPLCAMSPHATEIEPIAIAAYAIADAMLEARAKR